MVAKKNTSDNPATKKDLQILKAELTAEFNAELNDKIHSLRNELKTEMKANKNEILNSHDEIIKKLDDIRTDKLMLISRNRDHEERIVRLEQKVLV